ncbi:NAD(P)/FAD-dependent oxidoreductase [Pelagibius marinus]|uniref:NAD(P)/FAD-dependent oxidoreductase n=1 Tax=Pelagibius marinus TaxID=2762760 RepID=UPI0018732381|nr:FAD/NAD(P)-binding oxidoreductase [Pelagibius marinus]
MPGDAKALPQAVEVAVVGGGPAGLAAATRLKEHGVASVAVLDREPRAGGIPRHCGHYPFGLREFHRLLRGPDYARRLVARAEDAGVEIYPQTTVTGITPGPRLSLSTPGGAADMTAKKVLLATGVRETSRAARFIGGQRPLGVVSTGALQSLVYLAHKRPFARPVILGSELVSFSAIFTCRHAGIRPVAMVEPGERVTARSFTRALPRLFGVPLHLGTELVTIHGKERVEGVTLRGPGGAEQVLDCDGVIVTGAFTPEATLCRLGHLELDPGSGGPVIDQFGRCSDPDFFAAGNLLRPVETAGWSWHEGVAAGDVLTECLAGRLPAAERHLEIVVDHPAIKLALPQRIALPFSDGALTHLQLRVTRAAGGKLEARDGDTVVWSKTLSVLPERRLLLPLHDVVGKVRGATLSLRFSEVA